MATNSLQSLHNHQFLLKLPPVESTFPSTFPSCLFLKHNNTSFSYSLSSIATFSLSPSVSPPPTGTTSPATSFDKLEHHLLIQNFREADEETRRLLIVLAGDAAKKRGYIFFSEVQFISETDLRTIDDLWRKHSNGKFGYSVQKKIYEKVNKDFTKLFIKIGWMKKLDSEVVQYNYRSFPSEFIWELNDETSEGHLPLTNALRGTQLLKCILNHPTFRYVEEHGGKEEGKQLLKCILNHPTFMDVEEHGGKEEGKGNENGVIVKGLNDESKDSKPMNKRALAADYTF